MKINNKNLDIFEKIFYFVSDNGHTKVMFPESWNRPKERAYIIKKEREKNKN